ncbi:GNAT family N-acetyltransferase [Niallia sp. 03133]|uniref:GNAT family N-acetyltransferase n=1 Tax=Niallia sp. 03133 TaxID=3458060 RepID=UPI004044660C
MQVEIRLGTEEDIVTAHQLMRDAFEEYRFLEVPSSAANESVDILENSFKEGKERFILSYVNGKPVGSLRFSLKEKTVYFSRVSVPPSARGKGIGKVMLKWIEDYAGKNGKMKMECRVRMSLENNIRLYTSLGYVVVKEEMVTNPNGFPVKTAVLEKSI